jgi:hypothetical protein
MTLLPNAHKIRDFGSIVIPIDAAAQETKPTCAGHAAVSHTDT